MKKNTFFTLAILSFFLFSCSSDDDANHQVEDSTLNQIFVGDWNMKSFKNERSNSDMNFFQSSEPIEGTLNSSMLIYRSTNEIVIHLEYDGILTTTFNGDTEITEFTEERTVALEIIDADFENKTILTSVLNENLEVVFEIDEYEEDYIRFRGNSTEQVIYNNQTIEVNSTGFFETNR